MAVRFFKLRDGTITKTSSGRGNPVIPGMPEEPGEWIEISSSEFYWRKQGLAKRPPNPKRGKTRIDFAVELAKQGPEAVHAYCVKHFGHGSGVRSTRVAESV